MIENLKIGEHYLDKKNNKFVITAIGKDKLLVNYNDGKGDWPKDIERTRTLCKEISKEKIKYYKAYYKDQDEYTLTVPQEYFRSLEDFKIYLSATYKEWQLEKMAYGITDQYIEIMDNI